MKSIISIILLLVSLQTLKAQTFQTPKTVNMSKSYAPFNVATIDFSVQKLTIGEFGKQSIGYTITNSPKYTPSVKKYQKSASVAVIMKLKPIRIFLEKAS